MATEVIAVCSVHRLELAEPKLKGAPDVRWCPCGHAALDYADEQKNKPRDAWEVWTRDVLTGALLERIYTVTRGRTLVEDWSMECSPSFAANLTGRDTAGLTGEARESHVARSPRAKTAKQRGLLEAAQREAEAAESRRARLAASVGLSVALFLALASPVRADNHNAPRADEPEVELLAPEEIKFLEESPQGSQAAVVVHASASVGTTTAAAAVLPKVNRHDYDATLSMDTGAQVVVAGEDNGDERDVQPTISLDTEAPISVFNDEPWLRGSVAVSLTTAPGEAQNVAAVETFQAVEVGFGARRILGVWESKAKRATDTEDAKPRGAQTLETSFACEWAFGFRLDTDRATPDARTTKRGGCGLDFRETRSRVIVRLLYGYDGAVGDLGFGHFIVRLRLPVPVTNGIVALGVRASLGIGSSPYVNVRQFDYRAVSISIDGAQAIRAIRDRGGKRK